MRVWPLLYSVGASFARDRLPFVASKARSYKKISTKLTPMGWQPEAPQPKYMLIGTVITKNMTQHTKAFIVERQSRQLHIVQVNDRIGEQIVKGIEAKKVILQGGDQEIILQIKHAPFF